MTTIIVFHSNLFNQHVQMSIVYYSFPISECQRINSLIEDKSTQAAYQHAEEKLRSFKHKPYPKDINELR